MHITKVAPLTKIYFPLPQILSYFTSQKLDSGSLVCVPFGKKEITGIVLSQKEAKFQKMEIKKSEFKLKPISKVAHLKPILSPCQIELAKWISDYYLASLGKTLSLFYPSSFLKKIHQKRLNEISFKDSPQKSPKQLPIEVILSNPKFLPENEIKNAIKNKKQVLILIPEKSKSNFWTKKLKKTSDKISFFSNNSSSKKYWEDFHKIKKGKIEIIIGTRSALFAPFFNLGIIIITEEDNQNYKSEMEPRYDAREAAKKLAYLHEAKLILLSPSPSAENSFWAKKENNFSFDEKIEKNFARLKKNIINIKKLKEWTPISPELLSEIENSVSRKEKILLFLNRKCESTSLVCQDCAWTKKCKNCDVPLVCHYSKNKKKILACHHCGFKYDIPEACEECQSWRLITLGAGNEKIEEILKKKLKGIKIKKLDGQIAPAKKEQDEILNNFFEGDCQILITTALLFNYLTIKKVGFVAAISLDGILSMPDFRAEEEVAKTIQKLALFAKNNFSVQTLFPNSKAIAWIKKQSYFYFLEEALKERKKFLYPPFSRLVKLSFAHKDAFAIKKEIWNIKKSLYELKSDLENYEIIGPAPAFIPRVKGKYIWKTLIKLKTDNPEAKNNLLDAIPKNWKIDVDPVSLL